ncbi:MAG: Tol-Pal system subunit TolQ, partial [Alphaproteobacteria bacterium]
MEAEIGQAVLTGSSSAQDFSIIGMFMTATITVKIVIIMLLAASVWCWAIILEKSRRFRKVRSQAEKFEEQFWSGKPLDELYARIGEKPGHPMAALFVAAMKEWQRASERGGMKPNLPERV